MSPHGLARMTDQEKNEGAEGKTGNDCIEGLRVDAK